jgi:hypothetical protein
MSSAAATSPSPLYCDPNSLTGEHNNKKRRRRRRRRQSRSEKGRRERNELRHFFAGEK